MIRETINDLIRELSIPGEEYFLEKKVFSEEEDGFGNSKATWVNVKKLHGIIQRASEDPLTRRGEEEIAEYMGFFSNDFYVPQNELTSYRILNIIKPNFEESEEPEEPEEPEESPAFKRYFRIKTIERSLILDNKRTHTEMELEISKKWY